MPTNRLNTEVVITAVDRTGNTINNVVQKVERFSALFANLGLAKDTLNRIADAFFQISRVANAANTELSAALDLNDISLQSVQALAMTEEGITLLTEKFKEFDDLNKDFVFGLTQDDLDRTNDLNAATERIDTAYQNLGNTINRVLNPAVTFLKNTWARIVEIINSVIQKFFTLIGLGDNGF